MGIRDDLSKNPLETIKEAVEAGDKEAAVASAERAWEEWRYMHDLLALGYQLFLDFIEGELGEDGVRRAWLFLGSDKTRKGREALDHESRVQALALGHRAHGSDFYVEEDAEKTVFVIKECGTAGRLRKMGLYDNTDRNPITGKTSKEAHPWTFNQKGVPYHCAHCSIWFDSSNMPKEWGVPDIFEHQYGEQYDNKGNPTGKVCKHILYKKPKS